MTPLSKPVLTLVVAVAENGIIGRDGDLPWRMSSDLKRFRKMTMGRPIIMGRKTFDAIGRPLDGRTNIVVSRSTASPPAGTTLAASVEAAIAEARAIAIRDDVDEIMVIGGAQIYAETLPMAGRVYLTRIHAKPEGDACFPELDAGEWREISREKLPQGDRDDYAATLICLERAKN